jgi:cysteine desulfurase family protein (TIGR01976 family)
VRQSDSVLDLEFVRQQFPAFADPDASRWVHFENAGGSYVPTQVTDLLLHLFKAAKVQPYAPWGPSQEAGEAMDRSRSLLASVLNADSDEIHFGPSTSQNTYVLAHALRPMLADGDEVIVTNQDHEANIGAWRRLAHAGLTVKEWQVDPATGLLDIDDLAELLSPRTRLVCFTHCSNIAASLNPVAEIVRRAHALGALVVVDGVSWAPHAMADVKALGADVYLFSLYKTYGPHQGVMYTRRDLLDRVANQGHFFNAGNPGARLTPAGPDHAEIGAAGGVIDYYDSLYTHHFGPVADVSPATRAAAVFDLIATQEQALMAPILELLASREHVRIIGRAEPDRAVRAPTVAFHSTRHSSADIVAALAAARVGCNHGHFYAYRLIEALGLDPADAVVRLSMVHYNTLEEVHRACEVLDGLL